MQKISKFNLKLILIQLFTNKLHILKKEYDNILKLLCKKFFINYQLKCIYYKRDIKVLFSPNILN